MNTGALMLCNLPRCAMTALITDVTVFGTAMLDIVYRNPDRIWLFQEFIHQFDDNYPNFPRAKGFLRHWKHSIEGELVAVTLDHVLLPRPVPILSVDGEPLKVLAPIITPATYN